MKTVDIPTDDPVAMVRAIRDKHYEETKNMTLEERREYYREKAEAFDRLVEQIDSDDDAFPFLANRERKEG